MAANDPDDAKRKAKIFFERADEVRLRGHTLYAIELFLQGVGIDPESVEGHESLRRLSLEHKASGGKPLGMFERMKRGKPATSPLEDLLNAEKLLAYDPGNLEFMHRMQKAAVSGGFTHTASWIEEIIRKAQAGLAP